MLLLLLMMLLVVVVRYGFRFAQVIHLSTHCRRLTYFAGTLAQPSSAAAALVRCLLIC